MKIRDHACFQPHQPILRPYVKHIYHCQSVDEPSALTFVPTGNLFLALICGSKEYSILRPNKRNATKSDNVIISGPQLEMGRLRAGEGGGDIIVFEMNPCAIFQIFGVPQEDMVNQVFSLDDFSDRDGLELTEQAASRKDVYAQIAMLELYLCQKILKWHWKENPGITKVIDLIDRSNGNVSISALAEDMRISTRSIERQFMNYTGVTPKTYCRIIQFNNAFRQLSYCQKHVIDVALDAGYYDQAHFVNHFTKVMGVSPARFYKEQENLFQVLSEEMGRHAMNVIKNPLRKLQELYIF